ncbi:MAG: ATP-dependent RNA helicase HrpA [Betaproteobacteria bacterium]|nr:ATP-dependent RNA helicase HrpA [Betaproteobacteria bacterium]
MNKAAPAWREYAAQFSSLSLADERRLRAQWNHLKGQAAASSLERFARDFAVAMQRAEARREQLPQFSFPPELPVSARHQEIAAAIRENPVVIVCGETGSGKTTQLPKICLEAGRGLRGLIGHTQPRRLAARTVAARIAEELGSRIGLAVGCKVRFSDRTGPGSFLKLMTDGILLAEMSTDRQLLAYDTLIIDEAHERSLNIDFLLGYLKQLLPRRPELRLIITSATLDAERFAVHFGGAPVIEVSGRGYPVEIRYRPLAKEEDDDERELEQAVVEAVQELARLGRGDILVFLPGEREIRETADLLRPQLKPGTELLPLYARLSLAEQQRIFHPSGSARVVLATNVAETSVTVPGIHYVVDTGLARVARYSVRHKIELLQIEKTSRAAANQRAGRCGRIAPGICIRLYTAEDFAARPAHTDPEIQRSSLAAVILRMLALGLGDIEAFPLVDPPAPKAIADGVQLLQELGAVDSQRKLTAVGRDLARLPIEPPLARMVLAAREEGCLREVLIIAAGLSVPDPRERPAEQEQAAAQAQARFRDERSDFVSLLRLWEFYAELVREEGSQRKQVARCRVSFVSWLRLREWRDLHAQLCEQLAELGWRLPEEVSPPASFEAIHRALLPGLLGNIACRAEDGELFLGARGLKLQIHPGSGVPRKGTQWLVAAELTETTRLYARTVARVEPEWIERAAEPLLKRSYHDPRWEKGSGQVVASERVLLHGLVLARGRRVSYGAIAPREAHEIFLRRALVEGEFETKAPFVAHNHRLIESVRELEHKARRQDVLVEDDAIWAFYAARIPQDICTGAGFEAWRKEIEKTEPRRLFLSREVLLRPGAGAVTEEQFPKLLPLATGALPLSYRFEPGHPRDGVTLTVPLPLLNQLDAATLDWLVPGLVRDKVNALVKALPKAWRNRILPHREFVTAFLEATPPGCKLLATALREFLALRLAEAVPLELGLAPELPAHLRMNLRVVDESGAELAMGRDLQELRESLGAAARLTFGSTDPGWERSGIKAWDFGDLPESIVFQRDGRPVTGFPALVDEGEGVGVRLLDTLDEAERETRRGVIRLLRLDLRDNLRALAKGPPQFAQIALQLRALGNAESILVDLVDGICSRALLGDDACPRNAAAYEDQKQRARARLPAVAASAWRLSAEIAAEFQELGRSLIGLSPVLRALGDEIASQRAALIYPGFFSATPWERLGDLPRYLRAARRRLEKYPANPARDARHAPVVQAFWRRWQDRLAVARRQGRVPADLEAFRWWIEEWRVSLFAQELKTPFPVSQKRLEKLWADLSHR